MDRRKFLVGLGTTAVGGAVVVGSGAFSRIEAQRSVTIQVADDPNAYLGLDDCPDSANSSFADLDDNGHLEVVMGESGNGGSGVNSDSRSWFDDVFQICNQGKQDASIHVVEHDDWPYVSEDEEERRVEFYVGDQRDRSIVGEDNPIRLDVGECVCIGIRTTTHGLDAEEVDSLLSDLGDTITIVADVDQPVAQAPVINLTQSSTHQTIQDAVNAAATGDHLYVTNGTYDEQIRIGKDDLTIEGQSRDGVVIRPSSFENVNARGKETVTINPVVPTAAGGDPSLTEESWWRSSRGHYLVSGVTLRNLTIDGGGAENRAGIYATHAEDYTVENVVIKNNGVLGQNGGVGSGNGWCRNATFTDVELVDNGDGGFLAFRSDGFTIDGFTVTDCGGDGVDIHGDNHTLRNLTVTGSGANGVEFTQGGYNVLEDSDVSDNPTGIAIEKIGSDSIDPTPGEVEITIDSCNIQDNDTGLQIFTQGGHDHGDLNVDATNNWWGAADGPSGDYGGSGDAAIWDGTGATLELEPLASNEL